jgi:hypothetical protein
MTFTGATSSLIRTIPQSFVAAIDDLETGFDNVLAALAAASKPIARSEVANTVAEQFATSLAIMWENFVHEVLVAYVLRNHKKYLKRLQKKIVISVTDKFGAQCGKKLVFAFGTPTSVGDVEPLLNPKGRNVTVSSGDHLATTANELLKGSIARKFSLDKEDRIFIDLLLALRNFLAHRSTAARASLVGAIRKAGRGGKNANLHAESIRLNRYVSETCPLGAGRLKAIFARVKEVANEFD